MSKGSGGKSGGRSGSRPSGSRARSVGAAGGSPNGAILDDTEEVLLQRKERFKAWAKGFRDQRLKPNPKLVMLYDKSPSPDGCKE